MNLKIFNDLKKNLKKDFQNYSAIKVALLADSTSLLLNQAIKGLGFESKFNFIIWESDFNQIERQVFDFSSDLYNYDPEIIIIYQSSHKLLGKYNKLKEDQQSLIAINELDSIDAIHNAIVSNCKAKIIYYNYTEIDDSVFGNFANKVTSSFLFQLRKLNYQLMEYACKNTNFYICDISSIQNYVGKSNFFQPSIYINTEMILSIEVLPLVAAKTIDIIVAFHGKFKKCLILDLDNTIWGGIIGDDGLENIQIGNLGIGKAFTELQYWIKKLKHRGIILAVCSKNTESIAKEPFEKHPDMVLHLDDISVFVANWDNKVDNIRYIQSVLNIGFDSIVFLDDNPFERNIVRENIPNISVPELPEDPSEYLEYLYSLNIFETISFSKEDLERTKLYQIEAQRIKTQHKFINEDEFLKNLDMVSIVEPFNKFNAPRVAQLSQRSNQFNLRTIRYTDADILLLAESIDYFTFSFTLADKFGDNGIICVVILHKENENTLFIDTWLMSCRVLKRNMENFVLNYITSFAIEKGFTLLKGQYISTHKNQMVEDHYLNLGFSNSANYWLLNIYNYEYKKNFIQLNE
jgi:FkbH-like protein